MDWNTFFTSLFASAGGALGISLIFLRFVKKRVENYVDDAIQHRFEKKIEEYKQNLNKQFANYENFSKRYYDCIENVIKQLIDVEKYSKEIQEGISKCLVDRLTLEYIFSQCERAYLIDKLNTAIKELEESKVLYHICLPKQIVNEIEDLLKILREYTLCISEQIKELQIDSMSCQKLLEIGKTIHDKIELLSKNIRGECLRQSGE